MLAVGFRLKIKSHVKTSAHICGSTSPRDARQATASAFCGNPVLSSPDIFMACKIWPARELRDAPGELERDHIRTQAGPCGATARGKSRARLLRARGRAPSCNDSQRMCCPYGEMDLCWDLLPLQTPWASLARRLPSERPEPRGVPAKCLSTDIVGSVLCSEAFLFPRGLRWHAQAMGCSHTCPALRKRRNKLGETLQGD